MGSRDNVFEGLNCEKCMNWFSKMYLFKQHHRKFHPELGEFIDLPSLPTSSLRKLQLQDGILFAILHSTTSKPVLMRVFVAETHAAMRITSVDDLKQAQNHAKSMDNGKLNITVLLDVYPKITEGQSLRFEVVPRLNLNDITDAIHTDTLPLDVHGPRKYYRRFKFPEVLHLPSSYPAVDRENVSKWETPDTLHDLYNPFEKTFMRIVDDL